MKKNSTKGILFFAISVVLIISLYGIVNISSNKVKLVKGSGDEKVLEDLNLILSDNIYYGEFGKKTRAYKKYGRSLLVKRGNFEKLKEGRTRDGKISLSSKENSYIPIADKKHIDLYLYEKENRSEKYIVINDELEKDVMIPIRVDSSLYKEASLSETQYIRAERYNGKIYALMKTKKNATNLENKKESASEKIYKLFLLEIDEKNKICKEIAVNESIVPNVEVAGEDAIIGFDKFIYFWYTNQDLIIHTIDLKTGKMVAEKIGRAQAREEGFKSKGFIQYNVYKFFDKKENKLVLIRPNDGNLIGNYDGDNNYYLFEYDLKDGKLNLSDYKKIGVPFLNESYSIGKKNNVVEHNKKINDIYASKNNYPTILLNSDENIMRSGKYVIFYQRIYSEIKKSDILSTRNGYHKLYVYDREKNKLVYTGRLEGENRGVGRDIYVAIRK
ncbi:hypothetical protein [Peptostreptococcus faecalis]|uniref:hypothetical protein n=1 Tax=Peptostreptococcus faecalis TaxID=2045015 RepID=UPI000C7D3264|nr:hypothetical protein [Peptostreptococcus faecalis]